MENFEPTQLPSLFLNYQLVIHWNVSIYLKYKLMFFFQKYSLVHFLESWIELVIWENKWVDMELHLISYLVSPIFLVLLNTKCKVLV